MVLPAHVVTETYARPLRAVRQRLKFGPAPAPEDITGQLRSEVQRIEIEAELIELDELDALIPELEPMPASESDAESASAAIETVVKAYALAPLDDRDLRAIDTIAGAASGSDAATRLFYRDGINATGVERLAAEADNAAAQHHTAERHGRRAT